MNRQDAELRVAELLAAWPWASWPDGTVALYRGQLETMKHTDLAQRVVEKAIYTLERPPSISWLLDQYRPLARVRDSRAGEHREALPPSSVNPMAVIGDVLAGSEIGRWLLEKRGETAGNQEDKPKEAA